MNNENRNVTDIINDLVQSTLAISFDRKEVSAYYNKKGDLNIRIKIKGIKCI